MKKIIILLALTITFACACDPITQIQNEYPDSKNNRINKTKDIKPEELNEDLETQIDTCPTKDTDLGNCYYEVARQSQDFNVCLLSEDNTVKATCLDYYSQNMGYLPNLNPDPMVCEALYIDIDKQKNCYHLVALKTKNSEHCRYSYNSELCNLSIYFKDDASGAEWNLENEFPDSYAYTGKATVKGWGIEVQDYGNEKIQAIEISEESSEQLPPRINLTMFKYESAANSGLDNETIKNDLEGSSNESPKTIEISKIQSGAEGLSTIYVQDIY